MPNNKKLFKLFLLILIDILIILVAGLLSKSILSLNALDYKTLFIYLGVEILVTIPLFYFSKMYSSLWRYAGSIELLKITLSVFMNMVLNSIFVLATESKYINLRFVLVNTMLILLAVGFVRFFNRFLKGFKSNSSPIINYKRCMIIGAGDAGYAIAKEMIESEKVDKKPIIFIDDDKAKIGKSILGIKVIGDRYSIINNAILYKIDEIIFSLPSVRQQDKTDILNICKETNCKISVVPGIYEIMNGSVSLSKIRDVDITDLLGRGEIKVNLDEIMGYIEDNTILVTGGGGSIGSELSRQIATHKPKQLIILDIYENNAYDIEQELKRKYPSLNLLVLIASVRDRGKLEDIFKKYKIDIVFNAAAHKHVPLMETSPNEAIKNNVFGTLNLAELSDKYGVKKFVQISTDKAVNPTNIMGASKRICEMIIQTIGKHSKTCNFVAVRFGNVLGSNGSVIPLFKKQIKEGGPITVTDERITRFFMTIPEAVSLVLQAGAYAKGGEIYVLDMGEPVRIYDLALNLIKLSGLKPNKDIEIKITGLRPGEKLYEERLMSEEGLKTTANGLISIAKPLKFDEDNLYKELEELYKLAYMESNSLKEEVMKLVPTYKYQEN